MLLCKARNVWSNTLPEARKIIGGPRHSSHSIANIDFNRTNEFPDGWLECICGWVGRAYDKKYGELGFKDEKDWPVHKKMAPPVVIESEYRYKGKFAPRFIEKEVAV